MLPNLIYSADFVGFVFRISFAYDESADSRRITKEVDNAVRGVFGSGYRLDLSYIEDPIKDVYRGLRAGMKNLLEHIVNDFESDIESVLFNVGNSSSQQISVVGGGNFVWNPLAVSTIKQKERTTGSTTQKLNKGDMQNIFSINIPSHTLRSIDIKAGFNTKSPDDAAKVYANEFGSIRGKSEIPSRPILEPLFRALYNGFEVHFMDEINNLSNKYTDIRKIFSALIATKVWQSWWVL